MSEKRKATLEYSLISVKGKSIAYKMEGKGAPVVLLHGWPQTSHIWRKVVAKHHVILIDLPGLARAKVSTSSILGLLQILFLMQSKRWAFLLITWSVTILGRGLLHRLPFGMKVD